MVNIRITSYAFLIPIFALLFSSCDTTNVPSPPKMEDKDPVPTTVPKTSLDETAAKLLLNHRELTNFSNASEALEGDKLILISLRTNQAMAGKEKTLDLTYNETTKKWEGTYETVQRPIRDLKEETTKQTGLQPKSDWLNVISALEKNNLLSIRDAKDIGYKKVVADGASYTMTVHIDGKSTSYSHANPSLHAGAYPEIKDLANFTSLIKRLEEEFSNDL